MIKKLQGDDRQFYCRGVERIQTYLKEMGESIELVVVCSDWKFVEKDEDADNENMMNKKKVYYAHPVTTFNSIIEREDIADLEQMGFDVVNPNQEKYHKEYKEHGMGIFQDVIKKCDALAFRSNSDGRILAGVFKEIQYARCYNLPVFEMPRIIIERKTDVQSTRRILKEQGRQ